VSSAFEGEVARLRDARARVLERIADACARAGRDPGAVTLVAVTKTVPVERIRAAVAAGFQVFGENRVQEGAAKIPAVRAAAPATEWHLIGPLQSNKARRALETFDVLEAIGSLDVAARLDRLAAAEPSRGRVPVYLQVNVDRDPAKAGFPPEAVDAALDALLALPRLEIRGLMTIGRLVPRAEDARPTFRALRELSERLRAVRPGLGPGLSMGMTDDYWIAVEEGATVVRVGRAIFGERPAG
jgi:pyridoxal phosphate enzyme (YggS family)